MTGEVIGRTSELEAVDRFLEGLVAGPRVLVLAGEPGVGKTTVWRQVAERAAARALTVLSTRSVETETKLAFAGITDLLEPVVEALLPQLPEPQRAALEVALMRTSPPATPPNARAVAMAVLSALRVLGSAAPVVLAIDDVQWLDRPSADALAFALRRLPDRRVGVAATLRIEGARRPDPLGLDALPPDRIERLRLGGLNLSALHHVLRAHLAHVFPRPVLQRIAAASGGNPLFAIELARALLDAGARPGPGDPLPVPDTLAGLVSHRLDRLPARTREALLVAAAQPAPTVERLRELLGDDVVAALGAAERARVVELRDGQVRFMHPMLASVVYSSAAPETRHGIHRRLAALATAPEERARHLAVAATQPDEQVASALDAAAVLARQRGAPDAAGEMQEQAARLTPPADAAASRRRLARAAEFFGRAGDRGRARGLLEEVLAGAPPGRERAEVLRLLGEIRYNENSLADAIGLLEDALAQADVPSVAVPIQLDLVVIYYSVNEIERAFALSERALAAAESAGDPGLLADAVAMSVMAKFIVGRGMDHEQLARAIALEDRERSGQLFMRPSALAAMLALYEGRLGESSTRLRELDAWATVRGEESELILLLLNETSLEFLRGDFAVALEFAERALLLSVEAGSETMQGFALMHRAAARGCRGNVAGAREDFTAGRALMEATGYASGFLLIGAALGLFELSIGDPAAAERALAPLADVVQALAVAEPFNVRFVPDAVEALIASGQLERAQALLDPFATRAHELDRGWAIVGAARARSLLLAARGELDDAVAIAEAVLPRAEQIEMPLELGRALLVLGQLRRRRGERRAARHALERAEEILRAIGAPLWAERARAEQRRMPAPRRAPDELTATEERVAELAAAGRTIREVAQALFISPKTVEANLTRIYGKLGIRSRAELGAHMAERRRPAGSEK